MLRFLLILMLSGLVSGKSLEITQKKSGKTLEVDIISATDDEVTFSLNDKDYTVPLSSLTEESVQEINALSIAGGEIEEEEDDEEETASVTKATGKTAETFETVNASVGHDLFGTAETLWEEKAEDIAERLGWKLESKKENNSSYRLYTELDYTFLGAHPYCVTLYGGAKDVPERFSLVFANKGDYGSTAGMGEDHFKKMHPDEEMPDDLDKAIKLDLEVIKKTLTEALGEPEKQYYGEKEDMRKVQRWDVGDHSFLLSAKDEEYVHLLIVRPSDADAKGKVEFIKDSDLKVIQSKNVVKEENGDVRIDNIPMVDQGPKGYCAPATFERAMRYMQVPADMYLLATAATTQQGTNTVKLADDAKRIVRSKARRIKELSLEDDFEIRNIKKYIDKGVPVLWQMCSLTAYNKIANERTKEREDIEDFAAWAEEIAEEAEESVDKLTTKDKFHICMVIGYNEETNEVAVSDSWGPRYELRWVHLDICKAVTSRGGFVIDF